MPNPPTKYNHQARDIIQNLQRRIALLESKVHHIENKKTISAPIRDTAGTGLTRPGQLRIDEFGDLGFYDFDNIFRLVPTVFEGDMSRFKIHTFHDVVVAQSTTANLVTLSNPYVGGFMLIEGQRVASGGNTYSATVGFRGDSNVAGTLKIQEFVWSAGGFSAPTFGMSAAGSSNKTLQITTPGSIGNTTYAGLVFYVPGIS